MYNSERSNDDWINWCFKQQTQPVCAFDSVTLMLHNIGDHQKDNQQYQRNRQYFIMAVVRNLQTTWWKKY